MSKDQILLACQELLEEGKNITVRAVIEKTGGSTRDISPIVKEFKKNLERDGSAIAVSEPTRIDTNSNNGHNSNQIAPDPVAANLERVDRDAQLIAARKVIATAYYEKTQQFNLPGLQEEVNQALSEVNAIANSQDETLSPKGMLNWLKTKQTQPQH
jgi:hypothetical protein